jgi:hypothetical protein
MRTALLTLATVPMLGCAKMFVQPPPFPHAPLVVEASFGRTWDSAIDYLAENHIPIATLDRSSGLIVAKVARVGGDEPYRLTLAVCGEKGYPQQAPITADYNLVIRGDSARSAVKVNIEYLYVSRDLKTVFPCYTLGSREVALEQRIREGALLARSGVVAQSPSLPAAVSATIHNGWIFTDTTDALGRVVQVTRTSDNTFGNTLGNAAVTGQLSVQCDKRKLYLFVAWNRRIGEGTATVVQRLATGAGIANPWLVSSDGKATFFPGSVRELLREWASQNVVTLQVTPFGNPALTARFTLAGLNEAVLPVLAACDSN